MAPEESNAPTAGSDWLVPPDEQEGLRRLAERFGERQHEREHRDQQRDLLVVRIDVTAVTGHCPSLDAAVVVNSF